MGKALRTNTTVTTLELVGVKGWPPGAASAALQRNRELPQLWRHVALVALRSEHCGLNVAVDAMTARGFRIAVFSFFLPKRPPSSRLLSQETSPNVKSHSSVPSHITSALPPIASSSRSVSDNGALLPCHTA